jgi:hypothetical protein
MLVSLSSNVLELSPQSGAEEKPLGCASIKMWGNADKDPHPEARVGRLNDLERTCRVHLFFRSFNHLRVSDLPGLGFSVTLGLEQNHPCAAGIPSVNSHKVPDWLLFFDLVLYSSFA